MRDAIVAGLNLNVFHKHADRVRMTNIAQMINVLQAMVLTDKEKMLVTPTYHVFEMYKPFQNATLLPAELTTPDYKLGEVAIPAVSASAARGAGDSLVLSLVNTDPNNPARVTARISGAAPKKMTARILTTEAMNAHNTFDKPDTVKPAAFTAGKLKGDTWVFDLPAKSVVVATLN
jgi:alpha-N-arabinofuranosidase